MPWIKKHPAPFPFLSAPHAGTPSCAIRPVLSTGAETADGKRKGRDLLEEDATYTTRDCIPRSRPMIRGCRTPFRYCPRPDSEAENGGGASEEDAGGTPTSLPSESSAPSDKVASVAQERPTPTEMLRLHRSSGKKLKGGAWH